MTQFDIKDPKLPSGPLASEEGPLAEQAFEAESLPLFSNVDTQGDLLLLVLSKQEKTVSILLQAVKSTLQ